MERLMPDTLLDRVRIARQEIVTVLQRAADPTFDPRTVDLALVRRVQAAVGDVQRSMARVSPERRGRIRTDPLYQAYLEDLVRLGGALEAWQRWLLAYRAELDRNGERLRAAHSWAEAYNRTR
jgi:hypothetical protein